MKMTLRELLSHFSNNTIWVDLCTPIFRTCGELRHVEKQLEGSPWLDKEVSRWIYTTSLNIDM